MNTFTVLTCGSATVDVLAHTNNEMRKLHDHSTLREYFVYPVGDKMIITSLRQAVGGGGTNTAAAFSLLGLHTGFVGCLGTDANAAAVRESLRQYHVSFLGHTTTDATGYSVILDSTAHDRTILTYKGANDALRFSKIHLKNVKTSGIYCSSMMGDASRAQRSLCAWAKKQGAAIAYNPSHYQTAQGLAKLKPMLALTDVLVFNKEEAQSLLKTTATGRALIRLLVHLVPTVIITDGAHTIIAGHNNSYYELHPPKVKVVETTGAGDAFAASLFAGYLQHRPFEECLLWGLANSQSVIGVPGAKGGLLTRQAMQNYIKRHKLHHHVSAYGPLV